MIYVFALMVYLGFGVNRVLIVDDMYFYKIDLCNEVASEVVKRHSSHGIAVKDRVVAYCIPVKIQKYKERVF